MRVSIFLIVLLFIGAGVASASDAFFLPEMDLFRATTLITGFLITGETLIPHLSMDEFVHSAFFHRSF